MIRILCLLLILVPSAWAQSTEDSLRALSWHPGDHELLLMPTASTMPAGQGYFTAYDLIYGNFVYAPTSSTHIGFSCLFPFTTEFIRFLTIGVKQNLFRTRTVGGAIWATWIPDPNYVALGGVLSAGSSDAGLHAGVGYVGKWDDSNSSNFLMMLGGNIRVSRRVTLIVEYTNAVEWVSDFNGFLSIGLRIGGESMCVEIAGIRPLISNLSSESSFLFLPLLKATIML